MRQFIDKAMAIANDRTQSMFQQRNDFERLVEAIREDAKEKLLKDIAQRRRDEEMEDLKYLPRM